MNKQISERKAVVLIRAVGIFYIVSGVWEYLISLTQAEGISKYLLLNTYRNYLILLGLITFLTGVGILLRIKCLRLFALSLAWWNLFTTPVITIWWNVYAILIKRILMTDSWLSLWIGTMVMILIITFIRIYIIYILRISKAGYIFLKTREYWDSK